MCRVCQQIIAIPCGWGWLYTCSIIHVITALYELLYSTVNIRYTIPCHVKYYSRVPFTSYFLFTRSYIMYQGRVRHSRFHVWCDLLSLLRCFSFNGPVFFLYAAEKMMRRAQMDFRTCQVINSVTVG